MISVSQLTKVYGQTLAVDHVSFEVPKGQVVGFLGPNGAGKSTTLRMLTCYLPPTDGGATINGFDIFHQSEQVRANLGYLPENVPLYSEMRVEEYLDFRGRLRKMPRADRRERLSYVLERCWLKDVRRRVIGHLSKGYRQRVGLADSLLHNPAVLIMDEPTVGLDPTQIRETRKLIKDLGGDHTVMLSTHILPEVEAVCDRAIIIAGGRIVAQGTPDELRSSRRMQARVLVECRGPAKDVENAAGASQRSQQSRDSRRWRRRQELHHCRPASGRRARYPRGSGANGHSKRLAAARDSAGACNFGGILHTSDRPPGHGPNRNTTICQRIMTRATTIARRELNSYFYSPIAYVAMTLFLFAAGFSFWDDFTPGQPAVMRSIFEHMVWLLVFVIPVLCMGLISQEWATGTIETLMTAPLDETEVVMGKFLGSFSFFVILLAPTLIYVIMLRFYADPDYGPIFCGYLGLLLVGALYISISLFCSSLTRSQVVAAVASAAILLVTSIVPWYASNRATLTGFWRSAADQGVLNHYADFSKGIIGTGNLVYFLASTAVFLFLTVKVLESRRWK